MSVDLVIILLGAFAAAFAVGLSGFADALIATAVWLHVLVPTETTALVVACGVTMHGLSMIRLRREIRIDLLWPFLVAAIPGVPLGAMLVTSIDPQSVRTGIGVLLAVYAAIVLLGVGVTIGRWGGRLADGGIGFLSGILGGLSGLSGILPALWSDLRGWSRTDRRGVYQPFIFVTHLGALSWLVATGAAGWETAERFALCLPLLGVGVWLGLKAYGRIDDRQFRRVVLIFLLASGVSLLA